MPRITRIQAIEYAIALVAFGLIVVQRLQDAALPAHLV